MKRRNAFQIAETSESHIRGFLGSVPALSMALGIFVTYAVGAVIPWHYLSYFCATFPFALIFLMLLLPRSPTWLLMNNKREEAKRALAWFRGNRSVE